VSCVGFLEIAHRSLTLEMKSWVEWLDIFFVVFDCMISPLTTGSWAPLTGVSPERRDVNEAEMMQTSGGTILFRT
jgi:hypothetical protein